MYDFIINPSSGSGSGSTVWKAVEAELNQKQISYSAHLLHAPGEAAAVAAALSDPEQPRTIIVVGGDGTLNEVIGGLTSFHNITLGCIPTGSGNDFVRGLGLEKDPVAALHQILNPLETTDLDIGLVDTGSSTHSFCVSAGIGYDAAVCDSVQGSTLKSLLNRFHSGKLVYLLTALWQLLTMKLQPLTITTSDGTVHTFPQAYFAAFMNLPYEGGGFQFAPHASAADGLLDVLVVDSISRLHALLILPSAFPGKHLGKKGVHLIHSDQLTIHAPQPLCVHTDGEIPGYYTDIQVSLRNEKLTVITG